MKTFEQLQITFIKCVHKEGNDILKDIIYHFNHIIYNYQKTFLTKDLAQYFYSKISKLYLQNDKEDCTPKQKEIESHLKDALLKLREYIKSYDGDNKESIIKVAKWQLSKYLKEKDNLNDNKILVLLGENKLIINKVLKPSGLNYHPLEKAQSELIQAITEKYAI